jgi:hypothetical protein
VASVEEVRGGTSTTGPVDVGSEGVSVVGLTEESEPLRLADYLSV